MARKAGRNSVLYVSPDGTAAASPVAYLNKFALDKEPSFVDVTCFGDANKTYVAGLPDSKGSLSGFQDLGASATGSDALYDASGDGIARAFYAYMDSNTPTVDYFYGTAFFGFSIDTSVDGAVAISSNFQAASAITFKKA